MQTAQVANQQGVYLGKKLSKLSKVELKEEVKLPYTTEDWDDNVHPPFRYRHCAFLYSSLHETILIELT